MVMHIRQPSHGFVNPFTVDDHGLGVLDATTVGRELGHSPTQLTELLRLEDKMM